jgi:hypothetical protein
LKINNWTDITTDMDNLLRLKNVVNFEPVN